MRARAGRHPRQRIALHLPGHSDGAVKIVLLTAMAAVAGIAGFGYGAFSGVVAPELTGFALGTELIIWVALGGRGTLWGPLIGAVLINVATAYLAATCPSHGS
jgi:branched-chain amino acid transport system permease protein